MKLKVSVSSPLITFFSISDNTVLTFEFLTQSWTYWLGRLTAYWVECQLNPAGQANSVPAGVLSVPALHPQLSSGVRTLSPSFTLTTQFGRAYSQSQLYIPLCENQNKENVILVKSWKFETCNLTDFLDSVKENLFILLIYGGRKMWYNEVKKIFWDESS